MPPQEKAPGPLPGPQQPGSSDGSFLSVPGAKPSQESAPTPPADDQDARVVDFDDVLPHMGEFGRYQKILFLLLAPFAFFVAFVYFTQIFITLTPEEHWCRVPELQHLPLELRKSLSLPRETDGSFSKCRMYDVDYSTLQFSNASVADPSWPTKPCSNGWDYTGVPYSSVATELGWLCEESARVSGAQSIFFVGAIAGGLLFGWLADRYGRIPALVGANAVGCVAGLATAFVQSYWQFCVCRFLVGLAFDNCFTMMYILVLEYVGPKWRTFVANMSIAIYFTAATCLLPWMAYYIADWQLLAIVTSAPLGLALLTPLIVPESARWLVSQGKVDKAIVIMKKFEKINKKKVDPKLFDDFRESMIKAHEDDEENKTYSVIDLFRTPHLRKITILLIIIWMAISLCFDGHVRNVGSLGLDFFITFTIASATELPADTFLTLVLDRWGRRWLACGSMVLSGVFSLLASAVPIGPASASLAIIGRFSINISYNIGLQYAAELLPTVVRAQGVALIHIMGYVASILAPFIVYLSVVNQALPLIILGCLGIFGGLLSLYLPETLDQELPQTLKDGEEFGKGQRLLDFPCLKKTIQEEKPMPVSPFQRGHKQFSRASLRASIRGETYRSSMIQRSTRSVRSARNQKEEVSSV